MPAAPATRARRRSSSPGRPTVSASVRSTPGDADELALALTADGLAVEITAGRLVVRHDHVDGDDLAAGVNRTAHRAGITLVELSPLRRSLEDRYLALVNAERGTTS